MADIELVIKISEKAYNTLTHTEFDASLVVNEMRNAIANGTPLPKGYGRLIGADALNFNADYNEPLISKLDFDNAETIIEADKESEQ